VDEGERKIQWTGGTVLLIERLRGLRVLHWLALSVAIMVLEYYSGPYIQFAILLVFPVTVATVLHGFPVGAALAILLPLLRLSFFLRWPLPSSWSVAVTDSLIDVVILVGTAVLVDTLVRQERQLRALQGLLPICSFCKRIRDEAGDWRQLEQYIAARSSARFSHTVCPECGSRHYPELAD
jgi:K+-sensing histidine kinase KdpD